MAKQYFYGVALLALGATFAASAPAFALASSVATEADALAPAARQIADPYRRGLAEGWLEIATRQGAHVLVSNVYHDAARDALANARNAIDGSVPFAPIYGGKNWPAREKWAQAIRGIEEVDGRASAAASSCRSESAGRLHALTDEVWKEQDETHGTHWVHGWEAIERAKQLSVQVDAELARCVPVVVAPPPTPADALPSDKPVTLAADALFDFDSATLKAAGGEAMIRLAHTLQKVGAIEAVTVVGYTDRFGSVTHNRELSQRRAQVVADALKAQGVTPTRFEVRGAGASELLASCPGRASPAVIACLAPDRRVEIRVVGVASTPLVQQ